MPLRQNRQPRRLHAKPFHFVWRRAGLLAPACALLALTACGGGGGAPGNGATPSSAQLDGDASAIQVYAGASTASSSVGTDTTTYTLFAPTQADATRQLTARSLFVVRGLPASESDPLMAEPISQLVWVSQGKLFRMAAHGALNATPTQVSGLGNICAAGPIGKTGREDAWVLVMLANAQGNCGPDTSTNPQRVVKLTANVQNMGVDMGLWDDISVLAPLHHTDGSPGPLLTLDHTKGTIDVVDPTGGGALSTSRTNGTAHIMLVDDTQPYQYAADPQVSWQQGVLQANGKVMVLDWSGGDKIVTRTSAISPAAGTLATVDGPFGGDFLLTTNTQVWRLSPQGAVKPLVSYPAQVSSGAPAGLTLGVTHTDLQASCALVQHGAANPANTTQSVTLESRAFDPANPVGVALAPPSIQPGTFPATSGDLVIWGQAMPSGLQSLLRFSCQTGQGTVALSGVLPISALYWFGSAGRQAWLPHVVPPSPAGFTTQTLGGVTGPVLTGGHLAGYQPQAGTEVDWGMLPAISGEHIIQVLPRLQAQRSSSTLLFDLVTTDTQGTRHGALVSVQTAQPNSIKLIRSGLPVPSSTAGQ